MEGRFFAGWNMPGYLPDSVPADADSFDDAKQYLLDELDRAADDMFAAGGEGPAVDDYNEAIDEVETWNEDDGDYWSTNAEGYVWWIERDLTP